MACNNVPLGVSSMFSVAETVAPAWRRRDDLDVIGPDRASRSTLCTIT